MILLYNDKVFKIYANYNNIVIMLETVATIITKYGTTYGIALLSSLFFIFSKKNDFSGLIYLLSFTMIYNTILKDIFQMPLPATCPAKGFGFPSGHMNFCSVFYFWLFFVYKSKLSRCLTIFLMTITGISMVLKGFHFSFDVMAGAFCALLMVSLCIKYLDNLPYNTKFFTVIIGSISLTVVRYLSNGFIDSHIFLALYFILGFGLAILFNNNQYKGYFVGVFFTLLTLFILSIYLNWNDPVFSNIKFFLFASLIPFARRLANKKI